MICVIDVIEGPAKGMRIWLKENQIVEVGRLASVDFAIPADSHLSRKHLGLDSQGAGFRLHDVGSANGTYLNNQRVTDCQLNAGDTIRAGMSKFAVSFLEDGENPHASDGITFQTMPSLPESAKSQRSSDLPVGGRTISFSPGHDLERTARIAPSAIPELLAQDRNKFVAKWWFPFFRPIDHLPVYEQIQPISQRDPDYIALAQSFTSQFGLYAIVNRSQLTLAGEAIMEDLCSRGAAEPLMPPLYSVSSATGHAFWRLVEESLGQDAVICIGTRKTARVPVLTPFANSLGFPSLLGIHLRSPGSQLAARMLDQVACVIFEWNRDGKLGIVTSA